MTANECEMSLLPPEQCSHCRGLDKPEPKPKADWQVPAGYPSRCPECGDRIREGDPVGLVEGEWLCSGCYDADTGTAFDDDHHRDLIIDAQMGVR